MKTKIVCSIVLLSIFILNSCAEKEPDEFQVMQFISDVNHSRYDEVKKAIRKNKVIVQYDYVPREYSTYPEKGTVLNTLQLAVLNQDYEMVTILLDNGADPNKFRLGLQNSPLTIALTKNNLDMIKLLVKYGADPNIENEFNHNAIFTSIAYCDIAVIKYLLEIGGNVNDTDNLGYSPFLGASQTGTAEQLKLLIEYGADINAIDNIQDNALHKSVANDDIQVMEYLLTLDIDKNQRGHTNMTPIMFAAESGFFEKFKLLYENGSSLEGTDDLGLTLYDLAIYGGNADIVRFLQKIYAEE